MLRNLSSVICLALFFGTTIVDAQPVSKTPAVKHDAATEAQLRVIFNRTDINKDGVLDPTEIARSYRGYGAKPAPKPGFDSKGNYIAATGANGYKYPDQIFLLAADRDGDDRVTWEEFDIYGEAMVADAKTKLQAQRAAYARAQRNFAARRNRSYSRHGNSHNRPVHRHNGRRR